MAVSTGGGPAEAGGGDPAGGRGPAGREARVPRAVRAAVAPACNPRDRVTKRVNLQQQAQFAATRFSCRAESTFVAHHGWSVSSKSSVQLVYSLPLMLKGNWQSSPAVVVQLRHGVDVVVGEVVVDVVVGVVLVVVSTAKNICLGYREWE